MDHSLVIYKLNCETKFELVTKSFAFSNKIFTILNLFAHTLIHYHLNTIVKSLVIPQYKFKGNSEVTKAVLLTDLTKVRSRSKNITIQKI